MKKFADIHGALDYAAKNQTTLQFPFLCKCNGLVLRVLSPELGRTLQRNGPSLIVSRTKSQVLELGYVLSVHALEELVKSISSSERNYKLQCSDEHVTVACYTFGILTAQCSFAIARRSLAIEAEEGNFVLLIGGPKTSAFLRFWLPLESRLLHSSISSPALLRAG